MTDEQRAAMTSVQDVRRSIADEPTEGTYFDCVLVTLPLSKVEAEALAAARIARAGSDLLAADCRPVAHAVADSLVAAGMGAP